MPVQGNGSGPRDEFSYVKQGGEENGFCLNGMKVLEPWH